MTCKECKFYLSDEYEQDGISYQTPYGHCRRYPPTRVDSYVSGFPLVEDEEWCGEFEKNFD